MNARAWPAGLLRHLRRRSAAFVCATRDGAFQRQHVVDVVADADDPIHTVGDIAAFRALRLSGSESGEQVDVLMDKGRDLIDSASELIRERPLASFGMAFATGWIISKLGRSSDK